METDGRDCPPGCDGGAVDRRRSLSPERMERFERNVAEIFEALGMENGSEGTRETPRRFLRALVDITSGYEGDPKLITVFATECRGGPDCRLSQVVEGPIPFHSLCEHHALPFFGSAYVGYVPHDRILGLSKLTRLVRLFAGRFTMQERLGREIADAMESMLGPHGVAVYLEASHMCTRMRGVRESASRTRTTHWRGSYASEPPLRAEFRDLCGAGRRGEDPG